MPRKFVLVISSCVAALIIVVASLIVAADYLVHSVSDNLDSRQYGSAIKASYCVESLSLFVSDFTLLQMLCERGYAFGVQGDYAAALTSYQRALAIDTNNVNPNYGMALNLYRLNRCEEAFRYADRCDSLKRSRMYADDLFNDQVKTEDVFFLISDIQKCRGQIESAIWYNNRGVFMQENSRER